MKLDYRGVWQLLLDASDLRVAIGLKKRAALDHPAEGLRSAAKKARQPASR